MKKLRFVCLLQAGERNFLPQCHTTWEGPFSAAVYFKFLPRTQKVLHAPKVVDLIKGHMMKWIVGGRALVIGSEVTIWIFRYHLIVKELSFSPLMKKT